MKLGLNLLLWATQLDDSIVPVLESIREIGFDGVEVPIFDTQPDQWRVWAKRLDELGLDRVAVTFCGAEHHAISPDAAVRQAALERNLKAIECASVLGATMLTGPYHSALGVFTGKGATEQEWHWAEENLYQLAEHAQRHGITLGLEYLNRFESYLVTNAQETVRLVETVNHPHCRMMFDTFHAHIEEKNIAEAIRTSAPHLVHVQVSENDRSTPGQGSVHWPAVFDALYEIGYDGWLSIEAFGLTPPDLASAAHIWRRMFTSEEQLARDGFAFLRKEVDKRWAEVGSRK